MTKPINSAAWQAGIGAKLNVGPCDYTHPGNGEITIRNVALAINPADWILQGMSIGGSMAYPMILGNDVAGEVVEVGDGVSRFAVGDRVVGQAVGCWTNTPAKGTGSCLARGQSRRTSLKASTQTAFLA